MNGFTFYICFGKYGGWRCGFDGPALRIVCGWVAIVIALRDIEQDIQILIQAANTALEPTTTTEPLQK